jgi:hypothetical protein
MAAAPDHWLVALADGTLWLHEGPGAEAADRIVDRDELRRRYPALLAELRHEYGAGILFGIALILLGSSIFRFGQEVRMGLSEADHFR